MKKEISFLVFLLLIIVLPVRQVSGCSTFCLKDDKNIIFGRNYDWNIGYGYMMTNMKNVKKVRYLLFNETPASWTSKYGSITFNQYGREYPIGGMNETGLVVEVMISEDTKYSDKDERAALDEMGWVQYQLDNSASIDDVIASNKKVRISNETLAKIHFLITDSIGKTLIVEYINGQCTFYYDKTLPQKCLTNDTYSSSLEYLKQHKGFGGVTPIDYQKHFGADSYERFAIIADMISKYKPKRDPSIIDYSFDILNKVKDDKLTQFQIVYDIKKKTIYFRSQQSGEIKSVSLKSFNFDCTSGKMMFDINTSSFGNIRDKFLPYDSLANKKLVLKAYWESGFGLEESALLKLAEWPEKQLCDQNK